MTYDAAILQWQNQNPTKLFEKIKPGGHVAVICMTLTYHRTVIMLEDQGFEIRDQISWLDTYQITPVVLARKPLKESTIAANVLRHGTGALNIEAARIPASESTVRPMGKLTSKGVPGGAYGDPEKRGDRPIVGMSGSTDGRFPANVILTSKAGEQLDQQTGVLKSGYHNGHRNQPKTKHTFGSFVLQDEKPTRPANEGGASRFYKQCDTLQELIEYLTALILPPGGALLEQ